MKMVLRKSLSEGRNPGGRIAMAVELSVIGFRIASFGCTVMKGAI